MAGFVDEAFQRHYGDVFRYLLVRTGDRGVAEELTQRVFVDAVAAESKLERDQRPILPWLLAVAQRRWIDYLRREPRRSSLRKTGRRTPTAEVHANASLASAVNRALAELSPAQREVVVRRLLIGQSFREIAAQLRTSEGAVKMRFRRGIESVREALLREGIEP